MSFLIFFFLIAHDDFVIMDKFIVAQCAQKGVIKIDFITCLHLMMKAIDLVVKQNITHN